jgi:transcriptional regulator CBF1
MSYQHNLDPGPSSHPRGPPNLGQLSALASGGTGVPHGGTLGSPPLSSVRGQEMEEGGSDDELSGGGAGAANSGVGGGIGTGPGRGASASAATGGGSTGGRTRSNRSATMGSDEWSRQRKDNHVRFPLNSI